MTPTSRFLDLSGEYRWANESGLHGMISIAEAEYFGYVRWRQDPRFPDSWLMKRVEVTP